MSKHLSFFLFLLLNLFISSVKADVGQLSAGEREDNRLQQILFCESDADCDDQDPCTNEICLINGINDIRPGRCLSSGIRENCGAMDCNDNNPCTSDQIGDDNLCRFIEIPQCQTISQDCNDSDPCTIDVWSEVGCVYTSIESCKIPETLPENSTPTSTVTEEKPEPKPETANPAVTNTTSSNPDTIFGGACALNKSAHPNSFTWMITFGATLFLIRQKILRKKVELNPFLLF